MTESVVCGVMSGSWPESRRVTAPFELTVLEADALVQAKIAGALDVESSPKLLNRLEATCKGKCRLVLDLRQAAYVDSSGVRALMLLHSDLEASGGELCLLVKPGSRVERVLSLLQLLKHFRIYETAAEAGIARQLAA